MASRCNACSQFAQLYAVDITAAHRKKARAWTVVVCRDCWRAFEALLDTGAKSHQPDFHDAGVNRFTWFL